MVRNISGLHCVLDCVQWGLRLRPSNGNVKNVLKVLNVPMLSHTQCERQRVCVCVREGELREAVGEKKTGDDTGRLTLITQTSLY